MLSEFVKRSVASSDSAELLRESVVTPKTLSHLSCAAGVCVTVSLPTSCPALIDAVAAAGVSLVTVSLPPDSSI